jgi:D-3-phosphoglycerate dehydrogenase
MPKWVILIADDLEERGLEAFRASAQVLDRRGISPDELRTMIVGCDAVIVRSRTKITASLLATALAHPGHPPSGAAPRLKVVGRAGVGVDNIDLQAARDHGVMVVNTPTATTLAVAELTLGLIFALARRIPQADAAIKAGQWLKKELIGQEIHGKTLGLLGLGNIGATVARSAGALGMCVLGYDPLLSAQEISSRGAQPVALDELYARSDYISLHVPLTLETRGMIDQAALGRMKAGVRLVCTARGGLIEEDALLEALDSGQVAGAGLDVWEHEPPGRTPLALHPNVIATPHIGAQTGEAQGRAAELIAQEVLAALEGQPVRWRVV